MAGVVSVSVPVPTVLGTAFEGTAIYNALFALKAAICQVLVPLTKLPVGVIPPDTPLAVAKAVV